MKNNFVLLFLLLHLSSCALIQNDKSPPLTFYSHSRSINLMTSGDDKIFPKQWLLSPINATAQSLDDDELQRCHRIILRAFDKYPADVLFDNLKVIYLLSYLEYFGVEAGGTNSLSDIYLQNKGEVNGYTDSWIEKTFHAEFSSILLRNYSDLFDQDEWQNINGSDFHYGRGGVEAIIVERANKSFDELYNESGFLHEYAESSLENDFNAFAEYLFMGDKKFWRLIDMYPKLSEKLNKVIQFYQQIHPSLNANHFERLIKK